MSGIQFNRRAARKIKTSAKKVDRQNSLSARGGHVARLAPDRRYWGKLTEDLEAPSNGQTSPTTAKVQVWKPDPASTAMPVAMIDDDDIGEIDVVNRDTTLEGSEGLACKIEYVNGEWSFYWVGCE